MKTLILVDLQNDFMPGGALAVPGGDHVVPLANALAPRFDLVLATQDWHPPGHVSFAASHRGRQVGDVIKVGGIPQILWPVHCVQGTPGAAFHKDLNRARITRVIQKGVARGIDSYSIFFDNGHLRSTGLADFLKERSVSEFYICGLATDYCIKYSVLDALALGLKPVVIRDACRAVNIRPDDERRALEEMREAGAAIVTSRHLHLPMAA